MAEKLSIQIALDGGDEIERQLADIGKAGQKAFAEISKSAEQVGGFKNLKPEEVTAKLQEMGVTGVDAIDKIKTAVSKAGKLEDLVRGVQTVEGALSAMAKAAPIAGAALVAIFTAASKAAIDFATQINKVNDQAIKLGVGVEQLDRFRAGLEQAGVSAEGIASILQSKLASEQGVKGLDAFIQALERMPDSAARSKAAVEQFGSAGAELIRILQAGGRLTGFGGTQGLINADDARKATELGQAINQLQSAINRLNTLGFAPALTTGINVATAAVQTLGGSLERTPWMTLATGVQLVTNPLQGLANLAILAGTNLLGIGTAAQQTGQQAQQGVQIWTQWGTAATQAGQQATVAVQGAGTAANTAGQQVQQGGVQIWTQWGTAASMAGGQAVTAVDGAAQAASQPIPTTTWTDWATSAATAVDTVIARLRTLLGLSQQTAPAAAAATGGGGRGLAGGGFIGGRGTGTSDSNLAWLSRGEYIMPANAVRQPGVLAFLEALRRSGRIPGFAAGGLVSGGGTETITVSVNNIVQAIEKNSEAISSQSDVIKQLADIVNGLVQTVAGLEQTVAGLGKTVDSVVAKVSDLAQFAMKAISQMIEKSGKARGGLLGGRGTGTSDSNLAWVSRGEHIMPARAVAQPGVLAFLEALRRSGGNLSRVLDGMGRFALGGMVPRAIPAFAGGGLAGGSNVTIQFPGLPAISGLRASSDVVDQLHKAAALAQVRSGGRKPSRYS